jgi:dolichol-phosphate mannosyltransferase
MKILVIIPTYNERENIAPLIDEIIKLNPNVDILVVDDNSPDQTAQVVKEKQNLYPSKVHLLTRPGKQGLGKAYLAGFDWGFAQGYEAMIEMDADFSHRPIDLVTLVEKVKTHDFVIGSRYVKGGSTLNWGFFRKLISRGGSLYARLVLGYPIRDWTGGFNAWQTKVIEKIGTRNVTSEGYSFQIELKYRAMKLGFRGIEVPILFEDRRVGQSKMSSKIVLEALFRVWSIRA